MASIIILAVVFVLDVLAFVLAIGAEKRRNTAAYVNVDQNARPYCVYGSDAATGYGIGALVLLAAGQAVIMVATRCFCCGRALSPGRWRAFAGFCFITCCSNPSMASIILVVVVFVLDALAFVLAIGAEKRRSTATFSEDTSGRQYCVYSSDAATGYGIGALLLLLAGQAVVMVVTRCFCCGRALSPGRWRAFSGFCFILCLLAGSVRNAYHTKYSTLVISGPPRCAMLRKGVFAAGAAFTFLTALFAELHYLFFAKARHAAAVPPPIVGGIGMTRM
uniref:CASP-like protein n=3 Tax=Oryza TaxID=4527 RepID=A0A0D3G1R2_9ORYZ